MLEPFFEPKVAEDLPHAWPDANTGADFGERSSRLIDVDLDVVITRESDGTDQAADAASTRASSERPHGRTWDGAAYQIATRNF